MAKRLVAAITLACCLLAPGIAAAAQAQETRQPVWAELSPEQKQVLAPVSGQWDAMPAIQRKRLLGVAKRYPKMKPNEQQRIQTQLKDWAKLTHEERALARNKYQQLKQLPPEKRQEVKKKWQEYQQLPEEKKEQLRRSRAQPSVAQPLTPEATKPAQEAAMSGTAAAPDQPKAEPANPAAN